MLTIRDALAVIQRLIELTQARGEAIDHTIIVVGGTALSAQGVRAYSEDVDLYIARFSDDVVFQVEQELRPVYGETFKLDVTATENLWGFILLRDIQAHSPLYQTLTIGGGTFRIKMLAIEDLFLLKLSADREKDRQDLPLLAARTTPPALIQRFNAISQWHGARQALLGYADAFIRRLETSYGLTPRQIIPQLTLPQFIEALLWESYYPTPENRPKPDDGPTP